MSICLLVEYSVILVIFYQDIQIEVSPSNERRKLEGMADSSKAVDVGTVKSSGTLSWTPNSAKHIFHYRG